MTYSAKLLWAAILVFSTLECANTQTQSSGPAGSATNGAGVFHVFGGVSEPHVIYAPKAEYSEEARRQKIEGVCVVILTVGQDGVPRNIRVKQTLRSDLDAKAVEAVEKWRYEPAMKDGKPMSLMTTAEVEFRIESDNVRIRELQKSRYRRPQSTVGTFQRLFSRARRNEERGLGLQVSTTGCREWVARGPI
jgi:TonB family protein